MGVPLDRAVQEGIPEEVTFQLILNWKDGARRRDGVGVARDTTRTESARVLRQTCSHREGAVWERGHNEESGFHFRYRGKTSVRVYTRWGAAMFFDLS